MLEEVLEHPFSKYLRPATIPHIWCPGCGNGIVLNCFVHALDELKVDLDKLITVSGIGCIGRAAGYLNTDSFHTTHGRSLAFASGVKLANPELNVVVLSGDGDLFAIGGNHFIHAARRNMGIKVICANNFNYGMTGGQFGATTPTGARTSTTPYGNFEAPFNIPYMIAAAGAPFVARWTVLHVRQLLRVMQRAFQVQGLAFVEIVSPCPPTFGELNSFENGYSMMEYFRNCSRIDDHADLGTIGLSMRSPDPIVVGNFVDVKKPTYHEMEQRLVEETRRRSK